MTLTTSLLLSSVALALLTFAVGIRLFMVRANEMRRERIKPQSIATSKQIAEKLQETQAADNFRNLFELPVLFYALCGVLIAANLVALPYVIGAWLFVLLRVAHSIIQCTYNRVMHRFRVFALSTLLLIVLWLVVAFELLRG